MKLVVWQDNEKKFEYKYNTKEELFEAIKKFLNDNPKLLFIDFYK